MALEGRSGHKTLLKLLLDKTNAVLVESVKNGIKLDLVDSKLDELVLELKINNKQQEIITGEKIGEDNIDEEI